jgi:hypothetical protein
VADDTTAATAALAAMSATTVLGARIMAGLGGSGADVPHGSLSAEEAKVFLGRAVEGLPEQEKLLVKMHYYSQMSLKEIGVVLGVGEDRASRLHAGAMLWLGLRLGRASLAGPDGHGGYVGAQADSDGGARAEGDGDRRTPDEDGRWSDEDRRTPDEDRRMPDEGRRTPDEGRWTPDEDGRLADEDRRTPDEDGRPASEGDGRTGRDDYRPGEGSEHAGEDGRRAFAQGAPAPWQPSAAPLPSYQEAKGKIRAMLQGRGGLSSFEAQRGLDLKGQEGAADLIRRIFADLELEGMVYKQGHKRATRYVLAGGPPRPAPGAHGSAVKKNDSAAMRIHMRAYMRDHVPRVPAPDAAPQAPPDRRDRHRPPPEGLESRLHGLSPERLARVLSARFDNGVLVSSAIELDRFRRFAADAEGAEGLGGLSGLSNDELREAIEACGTYFDGKVYAISDRVRGRLVELAEQYFDAGAQIIFYDEFYEKNRSWLFRSSVASPEMLREILEELFPGLYFKQEYFGQVHAPVAVAVGAEILRVWGDGALATFGQLAERLPYVPMARIKGALAQSGDFIWSSEGTYTHYGKVSISPEDRDAIRARAAEDCDDEAKGYVSFAELPMGDIEALNPGLSTHALHDAIYRKCLSDGFAKEGKIVTREDSPLDALKIMKGHFGALERCTVGEMEAYWKDLTGYERISNKQPVLEAGHAAMVRTDEKTYVADKFLGFDAAVIDEVIGQFVLGDYLPLKAFTTFGAFPDCGRPWNLFLLESYCRRFSEKYRFDCRSANSRNAGAVIRKTCRMAYMEIMADAAAKAGIALRPNDVNRFLYEHGYIGKSTTSGAGEVMGRAAALRGRG